VSVSIVGGVMAEEWIFLVDDEPPLRVDR